MTIDMKTTDDVDVITAHVKHITPADHVASFKDGAAWIVDVKLYITQAQYEYLAQKGTQLSLVLL
jgi:hypothetical protein